MTVVINGMDRESRESENPEVMAAAEAPAAAIPAENSEYDPALYLYR